MTRSQATVEDLIGLLDEMLTKPKWELKYTKVCNLCGCLTYPDDPSCPGCRSKLLRSKNTP